MSVVQLCKYYVHDIFVQHGDARARQYWLARHGLVPLVVMLVLYVGFATLLGPWLMRNRKPLRLVWPLRVYNLFMSAFNAYFLWAFLINYHDKFFDFQRPNPGDQSAATLANIHLCHLYLLSKYFDFVDTFFHVLRKKKSGLSVLHIYHHSSVVFLTNLTFCLYPTFQLTSLYAVINSLAHVAMFGYFGLSTFGPAIQPYLWWKRYLTQLQMVQFVVNGVHTIASFFLCRGYHMGLIYAILAQWPIYFGLFYNFYRQSYRRKRRNALTDKKLS